MSYIFCMRRSGYADLPLHGGHVPPWLAERMTKLGTAIVEAILQHYGHSELLSRLADPVSVAALLMKDLCEVVSRQWEFGMIRNSVYSNIRLGTDH